MKSKYIKDKYEKNFYSKIAWLFLFALYVLPQYFGFHLVIDFTAQRIMLFVILFIIFTSQVEVKRFTGMVMDLKHSIFIGLYIFVTLYTLVLRADIGAFLNPFIEFLISDQTHYQKHSKLYTV